MLKIIRTGGIVFLLLLFVSQLLSCQKSSVIRPRRKPIGIDGLVILNTTTETLYDVQLRVGNTNRLVKCSYIPASGKFTTAFPAKTYQGNPVVTTWSNQSRQTFSTQPTSAQLPSTIDPERTYRAVVAIESPGVAAVYLQPNKPR